MVASFRQRAERGALGSGVLSSILTCFATRKKDSGDLATELVTKLMERVDKLEAQVTSYRSENTEPEAVHRRDVGRAAGGAAGEGAVALPPDLAKLLTGEE